VQDIKGALARDRRSARRFADLSQMVRRRTTDDNRSMLYIARGFGDGFITLTDNVEAFYLHSAFYSPEAKRGLRWNDPAIGIGLAAELQKFGVPHQRCGKLLVAVNAEEVCKLAALKAQAEANGVADLIWLSGEEARALEPAQAAERGLLSPSTGIVDSHAFMLAHRGHAKAHGAMIAFETPVLAGRAAGRGLIIETGGPARIGISAAYVVNAAGLGAQALARAIAGMPAAKNPALHLAKGNYFSLSGLSPFSRLSDADPGRPRRASHARSRRTGQVWPGCRMDRRNRLRR
jgi:FAD dependent oxidoreductase/dTDP-4-dehydrorhamnose 3,5-epimerase